MTMENWYTVKVKYNKEHRDGTLKRTTEPYLVNAMSFTDAEARIFREVGEEVRGEFIVTSIARTDLNEIFYYDDAEVWYKAKVSYINEDADTGKEKKVNQNFLVSAKNLKDAYDRISESLKGMMASYSIPLIAETQIQQVFNFEPSDSDAPLVSQEKANKRVAALKKAGLKGSKINVAYSADEED